jgi:tRNA A-37 threonylcarbamoyl transferase component Bud32
VDTIYTRFAAPESAFYDDPRRRPLASDGQLQPSAAVSWDEWFKADDGHWHARHPRDLLLPEQGWKVHVSVTPADARRVLEVVSEYCHGRRLSFKFLAHMDVLRATVSKEGDRAASGKFITIYPVGIDDLHRALLDLDDQLSGTPGPYVLTDLRWRDGPLYVRYGAFRRKYIEVNGVRVGALEDASGTLVEDVRTPSFTVPAWVTVPDFLDVYRRQLADTQVPAGFPRVHRALHHSNAGGVYDAVDLDGRRVVVKEARPHVGFTPDQRDAVSRLAHENAVLNELHQLERVVRVRRTFESHGHRFLVTDRVDAPDLPRLVVEKHPLIRQDADIAEYREWALTVTGNIRRAVNDLHDAGYTHGDLHPGNILVRENCDVVLIDFEMARPMSDPSAAVIGAPGFVPADVRKGVALDRFALACIELYVFCPLTPLLSIRPTKAVDLADWAQERFDLPEGWATRVLSEIAPPAADVAPWAALDLQTAIDSVSTSLANHASIERRDRLWPGDPAQFAEHPTSLSHGAGGILGALHMAGKPIPDGAMQWFDRAVDELLRDDDAPCGLFDGLAGVAWAYKVLGRKGAEQRVLNSLRIRARRTRGAGQHGVLAGMGLVLLEAAGHETDLRDTVLSVAHQLERGLRAHGKAARGPAATGAVGLVRGWSGAAIFFARLASVTGDTTFTDLADRALDIDLSAGIWAPDGTFQVDEGWRKMPYLGTGSAGVALALCEQAPHSPRGGEYMDVLTGIERACSPEFIIYSGLMQGRAGLMHALIQMSRAGVATTKADVTLARHVKSFALHSVRDGHGFAFAGHGLLRLSADLATGAAGVLSALTAYQRWTLGADAVTPVLPFLDDPRKPRPLWSTRPDRRREGGETHGISALSPVA